MAVTATVQEFLRRGNVAYAVFQHPPAYSAQEEAAVTHVPGRDWAKAVVCFADGEPIQAVIPADREVDLARLAMVARAGEVRLAFETELDWLYPDCERGAMPPLGPLYKQTRVRRRVARARRADRVQRRNARRRDRACATRISRRWRTRWSGGSPSVRCADSNRHR